MAKRGGFPLPPPRLPSVSDTMPCKIYDLNLRDRTEIRKGTTPVWVFTTEAY
ncbi:hypothetical protein PN499_26635 [Kamptonema animale CS-326]|nr:hypothetical protein [Kamptonema animale CS-326]